MISEPTLTLAGAITEAVFGYVLGKVDPADKLREKLQLDPVRLAYHRALARALDRWQAQDTAWRATLFNQAFLQEDGAPVLAQFLLRHGRPTASDLAARWSDRLNVTDPERRTVHARAVEPAAADFLDLVAHELKSEPDLAGLFDGRALEQLAEDVQALRHALGAGKATPGTRRDYLHWLIERNLYLDPRGTLQTRRQVQVKLDDVYISLRGQREEEPAAADKRLLEEELARLEEKLQQRGASAAEVEDERESALARLERRLVARPPEPPRELHEVVKQRDQLVILGDPGSGKTTLLRYLALKHAQALWDGQAVAGLPTAPPPSLGPSAFPILVRIADYAEGDTWKTRALDDFLAGHCAGQGCPKTGLGDLLATELAQGGCLVVLDGLDEIVSADDRRGVVRQIENFVHRYDDGGRRGRNRFVVTSRIAGYRSAPLAGQFQHYVVEEMNDEQIQRFLERWCPAVEAAQTPELSPEARQATAQREIEAILKTVKSNPGVRRLAANPLLLRVLALIHRTGAQLPQRRVELYKLAADTLARTWRPAQGVPESALVEESYLTRLLGRLAYWLHKEKPTGLATRREVVAELGEEWALIKGLPWDADDPSPDVVAEVDKFLLVVREHTGLFVERAPGRYGFLHLTFEEYYAARHLVRHSRQRAKLIRQHLHDPRWQEPILLALGFVALDYPDEAAELLPTAILAEGEKAQRLGFTPSPYEDLLGRDYLFALRCLGDHVPAAPPLSRRLVDRLADELLHRSGPARFTRYRQALDELLSYLGGSPVGRGLASLLKTVLDDEQEYVRERAAASLDQLGPTDPEVVAVFLTIMHDDDWAVRAQAAASLGHLGNAAPEIVAALLVALGDSDGDVRMKAAESLGQLGKANQEVMTALLSALRDKDKYVRAQAAASLGQLGQASPEIVAALLTVLGSRHGTVREGAAAGLVHLCRLNPEIVTAFLANLRDKPRVVRELTAASLVQLGQASPVVIAALLAALGDDEWQVREQIVISLGRLGQASPQVVASLLDALRDDAWDVRAGAAASLVQLGQAGPEVMTSLLAALGGPTRGVRERAAASLGQLGQAGPEVVEALLIALRDVAWAVRVRAAASLGRLGQSSPKTLTALLAALSDDNWALRAQAAASLVQLGQITPDLITTVREALSLAGSWTGRQLAAQLLGQHAPADDPTLAVLRQGLLDRDNDVRQACAEALARLGRRFPAARPTIETVLVEVIHDPAFAQPDAINHRSGHDYAYDALWQLVAGSALLPYRPGLKQPV
ncbi:MAG: HEAT repeat domain-containing protein [Chloroflexota bacterium]